MCMWSKFGCNRAGVSVEVNMYHHVAIIISLVDLNVL